MTTRKQVMDAIKKLGCTVDEIGSDSDYLVIDAPRGFKFACIITHCLVEPLIDPFHPNLKKSDAYQAILADLEYGLIPCSDPNCDHCYPEEKNE